MRIHVAYKFIFPDFDRKFLWFALSFSAWSIDHGPRSSCLNGTSFGFDLPPTHFFISSSIFDRPAPQPLGLKSEILSNLNLK